MTHFSIRVFAWTILLGLGSSRCTDMTLPEELNQQPEMADFVITFIDVGQGDSALLELPSGEVILIDGGPEGSGSRILSVLMEREIEEIDLVILTHPHGDHYGGLKAVLDVMPVDEIWENGEKSYDYGYVRYREMVLARNIQTATPNQDEVRAFGDVNVRVLNREEGYPEENNDSLVLKVSFGEVDFLFTGDVEREESSDLVRDYGASVLVSEVVKVPHHGSSDMALEFIEASAPEFAVISCGRDNPYGHPHRETLDAYQDVGATIYRTDTMGTVIARVDYLSRELFFELN